MLEVAVEDGGVKVPWLEVRLAELHIRAPSFLGP